MSRAHGAGSPEAYDELNITGAERRAAIAASLSRTEPYDLTDAVVTHVRRTAERSPRRTAIESPGS
jgi:hypothetical protein